MRPDKTELLGADHLIGQESSLFIEIDGGSSVQAVSFSTNGKYLVGCSSVGVGAWQVEDSKQMARMETGSSCHLAVSKDGRWIAAGTRWDGGGCVGSEQVLTLEGTRINGVDCSPNLTRLAVVSDPDTVAVWDIATRERVPLHHEGWLVVAVKCLPHGDRFVTAVTTNIDSVRVWGQ